MNRRILSVLSLIVFMMAATVILFSAFDDGTDNNALCSTDGITS